MHLLATDGLTCPRCGPEFPLILLADEVRERRVLDGTLGCSNCRERYPVSGGFGDLRPEPRTEDVDLVELPRPATDEVERMGALLGTAGAVRVLLLGDAARFAPALARLVPDASFVAASPHARLWSESPGVDRMRVGTRLPFPDWSVRGVALDGAEAGTRLTEAIRVLAPGHRVVVVAAESGVQDAMLARGLRVGTPAEGVVVGSRGSAE